MMTTTRTSADTNQHKGLNVLATRTSLPAKRVPCAFVRQTHVSHSSGRSLSSLSYKVVAGATRHNHSTRATDCVLTCALTHNTHTLKSRCGERRIDKIRPCFLRQRSHAHIGLDMTTRPLARFHNLHTGTKTNEKEEKDTKEAKERERKSKRVIFMCIYMYI